MGCGAGQSDVHAVYAAAAAQGVEGGRWGESSSSRSRAAPCSDTRSEEKVQLRPNDRQLLAKRMRASPLPACKRLGSELEALLREADLAGLSKPAAVPRCADTLLEWDATIEGPKGSPYAGGVFKLALWFQEAYPFKPPRGEFITPCYHPNISDRGKICLNVLKDDWSPQLTISSLLLCISALLVQPNPDDPLNEEASDTLKKNPAKFEKTAREWTKRYAMRERKAKSASVELDANAARAAAMAKMGADVRRTGRAAVDNDVSLDPLSTYQTANGRAIDEDEALERALRYSALHQH